MVKEINKEIKMNKETKIKRTKQTLIDTIVIVVGSINVRVDEDILKTFSNHRLIKILQEHTNKSYNEIKYHLAK